MYLGALRSATPTFQASTSNPRQNSDYPLCFFPCEFSVQFPGSIRAPAVAPQFMGDTKPFRRKKDSGFANLNQASHMKGKRVGTVSTPDLLTQRRT